MKKNRSLWCKDILIFYMLISNWKIEWGMLVFLILIV